MIQYIASELNIIKWTATNRRPLNKRDYLDTREKLFLKFIIKFSSFVKFLLLLCSKFSRF